MVSSGIRTVAFDPGDHNFRHRQDADTSWKQYGPFLALDYRRYFWLECQCNAGDIFNFLPGLVVFYDAVGVIGEHFCDCVFHLGDRSLTIDRHRQRPVALPDAVNQQAQMKCGPFRIRLVQKMPELVPQVALNAYVACRLDSLALLAVRDFRDQRAIPMPGRSCD